MNLEQLGDLCLLHRQMSTILVLGPVHALLCLNMVSRMYYGVSGYAWGTYRSAKVGQKYQPRALGGVSL